MQKIIIYSTLFFQVLLASDYIINTIGSTPLMLTALVSQQPGKDTIINHIAQEAQEKILNTAPPLVFMDKNLEKPQFNKNVLSFHPLICSFTQKLYYIFNFFPFLSTTKNYLLGGLGLYTLLNIYFIGMRMKLLRATAWTEWKKNISLQEWLQQPLETQMDELYSELKKRYGTLQQSYCEKLENECYEEIKNWYWYSLLAQIVDNFLTLQSWIINGILHSSSLVVAMISFSFPFLKSFSALTTSLPIMYKYKNFLPNFSLRSFFFIDYLLAQKHKEIQDRLAYICFLGRCMKEKNYAV
jgi:hypothetical protein